MDSRHRPPVIQGARVRDASALDLLQPPDGDGLWSGQRPQPEFHTKIYGKNIVRSKHATAEVLPLCKSARSSLNVIGWRHTVEYDSLKLASTLSVVLGNP